MKFKPLSDRIVIRREPVETKTMGGIIIPDTATDKPQIGEIVAVGPGEYVDGVRRPVAAEVGQRVLFGKWAGEDITIEGEDYAIVRQIDILGKLG